MSGTTSTDYSTPSPVIVQEHSHPLLQNMLDKDAVFIMQTLNEAGFSAYLVGGGVRDLYLGKRPKDFDISTNAKPGQIRKLFPNSSTIGRRFRLVQVFFKGGKIIEVSTLRSLSEFDLDGPETVLAPNNRYGTLPDDAQRRDLSINSLFFELENNTIIDYVGGVSDLNNGIIRITGRPDKRINRDPVRMLRALRHSARTGFTIEKNTWSSIVKNKETIFLCPPSRIRDELFKDLYSGYAEAWFDLLLKSGLFQTLFPFYRSCLDARSKKSAESKAQLATLFKILDRITPPENTRKKPLPKYFILALLMFPWAENHLSLSSRTFKGSEYYIFSKNLRKEIDTLIGIRLNLRKSTRQEMIKLLCNLPQFVRFIRNNTFPKWLKKKSYYSDCLLFYHFYTAITSGNIAIITENITQLQLPVWVENTQPRSGVARRRIKPAFRPREEGTIFGLKRQKK